MSPIQTLTHIHQELSFTKGAHAILGLKFIMKQAFLVVVEDISSVCLLQGSTFYEIMKIGWVPLRK